MCVVYASFFFFFSVKHWEYFQLHPFIRHKHPTGQKILAAKMNTRRTILAWDETCEAHHEEWEFQISTLSPKLSHPSLKDSNALNQGHSDSPCCHPSHAVFLSKAGLPEHIWTMNFCLLIFSYKNNLWSACHLTQSIKKIKHRLKITQTKMSMQQRMTT